jgi:hypothetical protein
LLEAARDPSITLYVTSQILCEFYSVITNPRRVAVVTSPTEALRIISAVLASPGLRVLPAPARTVAGWMDLLRRHPVTGGDVFDLQIVAIEHPLCWHSEEINEEPGHSVLVFRREFLGRVDDQDLTWSSFRNEPESELPLKGAEYCGS